MKNDKIALIIALPSESQKLFEKENITVHYCGIGKVNAAQKTTEVILKHKPQHILNLGTAGSHKFKTQSLVEISAVIQRDMDLSLLGFPWSETPLDPIPGTIQLKTFLSDLPKGVCGTGDIFQTKIKSEKYDLVDMEAYAIAKVCKKYGIEFSSVKYISDGSDENTKSDWTKNLPLAAKALLETYKELLKKI